jgi:hypothetical protein
LFFCCLIFWVLCIFWVLIFYLLNSWAVSSLRHLFPRCAETFKSDAIPSVSFALISWAIGVLFRKFLPMPTSSYVYPRFSSCTFKVSGLALISLFHSQSIIVHGERVSRSLSSFQLDIQFSQHHLLKRLYFLQCVFWAPLMKIDDYSSVDLCLGFCSIGEHFCLRAIPWWFFHCGPGI